MKKLILSLCLLAYFGYQANASYILLPMDEKQRNHLKAYGMTYYVLEKEVETYWMLNYRGGSFAFKYNPVFEDLCKARDVSYEVIADAKFAKIRMEISSPEVNQGKSG